MAGPSMTATTMPPVNTGPSMAHVTTWTTLTGARLTSHLSEHCPQCMAMVGQTHLPFLSLLWGEDKLNNTVWKLEMKLFLENHPKTILNVGLRGPCYKLMNLALIRKYI